VERLEAFRLLNGAGAADAQALPNFGLTAEHGTNSDSESPFIGLLGNAPAMSDVAWDAILTQHELADLLAPSATAATNGVDLEAVDSGLHQMNRYLSRAWYRAAIPPQLHDDCSQAVFTKLLQDLGRPRFEEMLGDIGHWGVKEILSKETNEGVDFFRAVDMVKKRAQRERNYQSLDLAQSVAAPSDHDATSAQRSALHEAIDRSLNPREAALIQDTLMGKTPAEIAQQWGVAPKTVSNEKTRVLQKLRDLLVAQDQF
jgi:RNA polymerase sigma factor (sigma-70 family)